MATVPEALAIATQHHQRGRLQAAEQIYRQILQVEPNHADALHLLGVIAAQVGKQALAVEHIGRAIRANGNVPAFHNSLGNALRYQGNLREAAVCYRRALELDPGYGEAHNNLGAALRDQGDLEEAAACFRRAMELKPDLADAHNNLAIILEYQGKPDEAIACYRRALELKPDYTEAAYNLGNAWRNQDEPAEAIACYRRALELKPDYAEAHANLGLALKDLGNLEEAAASCRRAIELKPGCAESHNNLGIALKDLGNLEEAVASCRRAIELKPDFAQAHNNLAIAFRDMGDSDEAVTCFRRALELKPEFTAAYGNLGNVLRLRGRYAEAREAYENLLRLSPGRDLLRLSIAAICPAVFESSAAIDEYRAGLLAQVEDLARGGFNVDVSQLGDSAAEPPFDLLCHGRDDRPIKEAWARLFRNLPIQETTHGVSPHPKLGLVVTQGHEGIFLRWWTELLRRMKPRGWEIVVVCWLSGAGRIRSALSGSSIQLLPISGRFNQIVNTVREARFDVLCHWETGSDSTNYFLPHFRLAPVQCNLAGMQVTSGIPQMDYYLSSEFIEVDWAESHYSEKLLRARSLLGYHIRPPLPAAAKPREAFGFRTEQHLYVCPQNLRKFHPEFDPLLAGILQADPAAVVVIVDDRGMCVAPMLRRRFAKTLSEVLDRVVFLPHQSYADYLCLVSAADVILDPLYYSGGTTTLEALSLGKAIVTWPSQFQIGRGVLASYRKMGITGFVANDAAEYVRMAVGLGTDADYRRDAEGEILAASGALFEDLGAVREYQRVFDRLVEEARCG